MQRASTRRAAIARRTPAPARPWLLLLALAAGLAAYNNLLFALPGDLAFPPAWALYPRAVLVPAAAVLWAVRVEGFRPRALGLTARGLLPGAAMGLAAAAAVAAPAVLYFLFPVGVSDGAIDYDRPTYDSVGSFVFWAFVRYPLNAAIFEEVLFRGVLLALAARAFGGGRAIVLSAASFAAWHIVVNHTTMNDTNVADSAAFFAFAQAGALAALFVGGLALGLLRQRSGTLAAPIAFHWAAVVAMNAALYLQSR